MAQFNYNNTISFLSFCRDVFLEVADRTDTEKEKMIDEYLQTEEGKKRIVEDINDEKLRQLPIAKRMIIGSAYLTSALGAVLKYITYLLNVNRFFKPLNLFCDRQGNNFMEANDMITLLAKVSEGTITDREIETLAEYIYNIPQKRKEFWIRFTCGIIIYLEAAAMIVCTAIYISSL